MKGNALYLDESAIVERTLIFLMDFGKVLKENNQIKFMGFL